MRASSCVAQRRFVRGAHLDAGQRGVRDGFDRCLRDVSVLYDLGERLIELLQL